MTVSAAELDQGDRFSFNSPDSDNRRTWKVVSAIEARENSPGYWSGEAKTVDGDFQLTADLDERDQVYPIS